MSRQSFFAAKLAQCIRLARECSRYTWQEPSKYRTEYARIKSEAMTDAHEWRDDLKTLEAAQ